MSSLIPDSSARTGTKAGAKPGDTGRQKAVIGVVGNPNCGKTTLFNGLTGQRQQVGNWPGVTVEKKTGNCRFRNEEWMLVDLPGVYSLGASLHTSEDERVARDYVLSGEATLIVNIVDASNLERNLYLTCQLMEMGVPLVVALNMMDIARERQLEIDLPALSQALGCPVVPVVATRRHGLDGLCQAMSQMVARPQASPVRVKWPRPVERAIDDLATFMEERTTGQDLHWQALKLLEGELPRDGGFPGLTRRVAGHLQTIEQDCGEEADIVIADSRFAFVGELMQTCTRRTGELSRTLSDRIDAVVLDRLLGIPLFLAMMYLMFMVTINIGGAFVDFFDQAVGAVAVDATGELLASSGAPVWLVVLLSKGVGGGIQTVATFLPIIGFLYLFLSFLEDSGYMARAAFVMDRAMRAIGLPGKSFVPLLVGFGCNVPAIIATRTLEHRRDRILTAMMAPFMSCGARLPVYALFAAAFFPGGGQNVVFALYLLGLGFAVATGLLLKHTVLRGEAAPFVMELPPYHLPMVSTVVRRAWDRLRDFALRAGQVIVPMVVLLSFLNSMGTDGTFGKEDSQESVLAAGGRLIMPVFHPMGLQEENWPAAVGLFTGIFAKEAVVGTLNALYSEAARQDAESRNTGNGAGSQDNAHQEEETAGTTGSKLLAALATIPANLADVAGKAGDPLGLDVSWVSNSEEASSELEVDNGVFGAMSSRFDGAAGAFAYLLLILLYTPCVAASGAMMRETGWRWGLFAMGWTTTLGYLASVNFYQLSRPGQDPSAALLWGGVTVTVLATLAAVLWSLGHGGARRLQYALHLQQLQGAASPPATGEAAGKGDA